MPASKSITGQTRLAFDFLQKLYLEVSYLIKEIEGLLYEEPEKFIIGRPAGYGITTRSSTGLESTAVNLWLVRKLAVFFIPEERTEIKGGQTLTQFGDDLKVLYFRIMLDDSAGSEPLIYFGVLRGIKKQNEQGKWPSKFEHIMGHLEYQEQKAFAKPEQIDYADGAVAFKGKLEHTPLYSITDSEAIVKKIKTPALKAYRSS